MKFEADMEAFIKKAGDRADEVLRKVCLDMFSRIVMRTPVDTGRLRGNWQIQIQTPPTSALIAYDKQGQQTIDRESPKLKQANAKSDVWIANNLVYAVKIEEGHSKQAPAGMVRITINEFEAAARRAAREA